MELKQGYLLEPLGKNSYNPKDPYAKFTKMFKCPLPGFSTFVNLRLLLQSFPKNVFKYHKLVDEQVPKILMKRCVYNSANKLGGLKFR